MLIEWIDIHSCLVVIVDYRYWLVINRGDKHRSTHYDIGEGFTML